MSQPESVVKHDIKELLKSMGAWYCMVVNKGLGRKGIPDILACVPMTVTQDMVGRRIGLFVAIEAKAEGNAPTPWQAKELAAVDAAQGLAIVATGDRACFTVEAALRAFGARWP